MQTIPTHVGKGIRASTRPLPAWQSGADETLCWLGLDAGGIDFLLDYLPTNDEFTKSLRQLREQAMDELWSRNT